MPSTVETHAVKTHYRACHLCEAICGLEIKTQGDQVISIKGDPADPLSQGFICPKAVALQDIQSDPDRLRYPIRRIGDQWQELSWEQAFELAAENLVSVQNRFGENAVAIYAGNPSVHNFGSLTHGGLLRKVLKTHNNYSATSLDQLPHQLVSHAMYGHQFALPIPDIDHCQTMLIIGGNPLASNGSIMTVPNVGKRLKAIQQRGGKVIVIDPRRTETAQVADQHYFIRPGTDAYLLLAIIHCLFDEKLVHNSPLSDIVEGMDLVEQAVLDFNPERAESVTGVSANDIRQLSRELANTEQAICYGRMGVSVQEFGTLCQWSIQIINILIGALDTEGGTILSSPAFGYVEPGQGGGGHFARWHSRVSNLPEFSGEFPTAVLAEEITTPGQDQIRALITSAGNPVLSAPNGRALDTALEGLEFMVSIDLYLNETTRHADLILPPTGPWEHDHYDLAFHRLAVRDTCRYNPVIFEPGSGSLHDWQIMNGLAGKIAQAKNIEFKSLPAPDKIIDSGIRHGRYGESSQWQLSLDKIRQSEHGIDLGPLKPGIASRLCTESRQIQAAPEFILRDMPRLANFSPDANSLLMIGRRHVRSNNSWMHNYHRLVKGKPRWQLLMHPDDMQQRNIEDGTEVIIRSRVGEVQTQVEATEDIMPGVVSLPHGWGHQRTGVQLAVAAQQNGVSCNDLTDEKFIDQVSGNAALNAVAVSVVPA